MRFHSVPRFLAYAFVIAALMIPVAYWTIAQGGPYARAQRFLSSNPAIERQVGRVKNVRLAFSRANSWGFGADDGSAHLELVVTGERGVGFATIDLHWERGAWDVTSVLFRREGESIPVQTFPIEKPRSRGMMLVINPPKAPAPPPRTS
jgi:hypothetical protein